jgi:hypothetical protein
LQANRKDIASGGFFAAVGLLYGSIAWRSLDIGTALEMGPGYFPLILSGFLIALGAVIAIRGLSTGQQSAFGIVPWRGIILLSLATIVFAAFFDDLGMFPGVLATAFLAALSSPQIPVVRAMVTAFCIAVFCTVVFSYGIHLPVPVIGPLFGF